MNKGTAAGRIVLAYSGGLNGSVAIRSLAEAATPVEIVTVTLDLGQAGELEEVRDRALAIGAARAHVLDVRDELARDYLLRALKADALDDHGVPMVGALAAPLIARKLVEIAGIEQAAAVAHGAADPSAAARIEAGVRALDADLTVLAPARESTLGRLEAVEYAAQRGITVPVTADLPHGTDANVWGRVVSCVGLDGWSEVPEEVFALTQPAATWPGESAYLEIAFERGAPVAVNGVSMSLIDLIGTVGMIAGAHGVGRRDVAGARGRGVTEAPAALVLHAAHADLQRLVTAKDAARFSQRAGREYADVIDRGAWFSPLREALDAYVDRIQDRVNGTVRIKLYKGDARIVGRKPLQPKAAAKRLKVVAAKPH
jgi:argininosuccinate synthase